MGMRMRSASTHQGIMVNTTIRILERMNHNTAIAASAISNTKSFSFILRIMLFPASKETYAREG